MNIGIDIRLLLNPVRTGVGEYTFQLVNSLLKNDKTNNYFLFHHNDKKNIKYLPDWKQNNVKYVTTNWPHKLFNFCQKMVGLPKIDKLAKEKLDVYISPNINFTSISKKTKHVLTIHDISFILYPKFYSLKQRLWHFIINPRKQCKTANLIIVPSQNTKNDLINHFKICADKIKVVYPGIKKELFDRTNNEQVRIKYGLPNKYILFLGTIEPRKNIITLIEGFEKTVERLNYNYKLVIAGAEGWKNKDIYKKAKHSKYHDLIRFIGYINTEDKNAIYDMAEMFVYPSIYEGFGFPVLEAMATNTPVITSNRSSLPEILENSALLINPNKPSEIGDGIIEVIKNQELKKYLIEKGEKQVNKYNWDETSKKLLDILCE